MIDQMEIPKDRLLAFSGEHLYYELNMFFGVSELLKKGINDQFIYSALLEAFVIHTCLLLDFFYKPPRKLDDASALHFIDDVKKWKKLRPSYDMYFRRFYRRRNREVVHLSYMRLDVEREEKMWNIARVIPIMKSILRAFFEAANPDLLHPNLRKIKKYISDD